MKQHLFALLLLGCLFNAYSMKNKEHHEQTMNQIRNGYICVPNVSHGYSSKKLTQGIFKTQDEDVSLGELFIEGTLEGKEVVITEVSNWTGGSGIFNSLLLFERHNGKMITTGSYSIGDRVALRKLSFSGNKIKIVTLDIRSQGKEKPETTLIQLSDFEKAECIQEALTNGMKTDADELVKTYIQAFSEDAITAEQKKRARAILERHQKDQRDFLNIVRLLLEEKGYEPGPNPVSRDNKGNFSIWVDFTQKSFPL